MNRKALIQTVEKMGGVLLRHAGKHDIYHNPRTGATQPIPRHREINETLARKIIKDLSGE